MLTTLKIKGAYDFNTKTREFQLWKYICKFFIYKYLDSLYNHKTNTVVLQKSVLEWWILHFHQRQSWKLGILQGFPYLSMKECSLLLSNIHFHLQQSTWRVNSPTTEYAFVVTQDHTIPADLNQVLIADSIYLVYHHLHSTLSLLPLSLPQTGWNCPPKQPVYMHIVNVRMQWERVEEQDLAAHGSLVWDSTGINQCSGCHLILVIEDTLK